MARATTEEKENRILFLRDVAEGVIESAIASTRLDYGEDQARQVAGCIRVDNRRLAAAVEYYYDYLLYNYKKFNGYIDEERLAGRDKMAALTAIALLTFKPIDVKPYSGRATGVAEINESFALYFASIVLHVDVEDPSPTFVSTRRTESPKPWFRSLLRLRSGLHPATSCSCAKDSWWRRRKPATLRRGHANAEPVPNIVVRTLLLNFRDLGAEARQRAHQNKPVQSTEPLADWVIQSMQLYALAFGIIDLRL
ncbi:hypothetical protein [Azospirillum thermophilum]|uniref:Uncharacterized protein n=1 Tax=Azospirillum thermophilum TaxID=2202148 RepID=A0A2S2CL79_9PROT|nr:hypothetical protein [Azospirillum thermophilum]AWK85130.1 hypothetical protein DEW08_02090 [Azospirillum thermophilum]